MSDASRALQSAIFDALDNGLSISVYDFVDPHTLFPYVTVGDDVSADSSSKVENTQIFTVTIHVWSRQRGRWEVKDIMSEIDDLLHEQPLPMVDGFSVSSIHRDSSQTLQDPDGLTMHGIISFNVRVNHD